MRILIAEDNPTSRVALSALLKKFGYEVVETCDGAEAWRVLQEPDAPRLAIIDWMMPEMDGLEVVRRVRAVETSQPPYLIILTAKDDREDLIAGLDAGADDYLVKPFDAGVLRARVGAGRRLIEMQERVGAQVEELAKSEAKYRLLVDHSSEIIWNLDAQGVINFASPSIERLTGRPLNSIINQPIQALVHPDDLAVCLTFIDQAIHSPVSLKSPEYRFRHADGSWHWQVAATCPVFDAEGRFLSLVGISHDVTEAKKSQEALRKSEELYCAMFDKTKAIKLLIDPADGAIVDANTSASEFYGYSQAKLKSMKMSDMNCTVQTKVRQEISQALAARSHILSRHRTACGEFRDVEIYSSLIEIGGRVLLHSIIHDVTDRNRIEAERFELERRVHQMQKAESLGRMAGAIAHQYNNMMGAVLGYLELSLLDLPAGGGAAGCIREASKAANRAAGVSSLMLTYLGQVLCKHEPIDLSEACRVSLAQLAESMQEGVELRSELPFPGPTVEANAHQFQQVVANLLTNAEESSNGGKGTVTVEVKTVSALDIPDGHRFPLEWQPQALLYACLEVTDTGCGISQADIEKIFDPFFTSKFTGRGLGLPVVLGIVRAHQGGVIVESEEGRGSVFQVYFPVSDQVVLSQPENAAKAGGAEERGTILLVEDEQSVREMAKSMLVYLGFEVLEARDGVEAVQLFRENRDAIRLVFSDLNMPRMNGWETLTALRKMAPGIPAILASGYDQAQVMAGDHPELPQVFLGKPYQMKSLTEAIRQAMDAGKGGGAD